MNMDCNFLTVKSLIEIFLPFVDFEFVEDGLVVLVLLGRSPNKGRGRDYFSGFEVSFEVLLVSILVRDLFVEVSVHVGWISEGVRIAQVVSQLVATK